MPSKADTIASFVEAAPPGELENVIADIKALTVDEPQLTQNLAAAYQSYNEDQLATVKLPGSSEPVVVTKFNSIGGGRYFDPASQSSFAFDHELQKASGVQSHVLESKHSDFIESLIKSFSSHSSEHYPAASIGAYPTDNDSSIALVLVSNKYSLNNFWSGRWRSIYTLSSSNLSGAINLDVHYFEDGNVRMQTEKPISESGISTSSTAPEIVRRIASAEKKYHQDLNRAFTSLNEGAFKGLRRQLPVTRQKVEWEKIAGYRLGQDIGGGRSR